MVSFLRHFYDISTTYVARCQKSISSLTLQRPPRSPPSLTTIPRSRNASMRRCIVLEFRPICLEIDEAEIAGSSDINPRIFLSTSSSVVTVTIDHRPSPGYIDPDAILPFDGNQPHIRLDAKLVGYRVGYGFQNLLRALDTHNTAIVPATDGHRTAGSIVECSNGMDILTLPELLPFLRIVFEIRSCCAEKDVISRLEWFVNVPRFSIL